MWLEADNLIRRLSGGHRSLDEFCRRFFGGANSPPEVRPYDFSALVEVLNDVQPYDWRQFWEERLSRHGADAPSEGLLQSGWRLQLDSTPSLMHRAHEADDHDLDLRFSLGFYVNDDATLSDVIPGSPADSAGLSPGDRLVAVNGRKWSRDELRDALAATAHGASRLTLLIERGDLYQSAELSYSGGQREPHLVRIDGPRQSATRAISARRSSASPPPDAFRSTATGASSSSLARSSVAVTTGASSAPTKRPR